MKPIRQLTVLKQTGEAFQANKKRSVVLNEWKRSSLDRTRLDTKMPRS